VHSLPTQSARSRPDSFSATLRLPLSSMANLSPTDDGHLCHMCHHSARVLICNGPTTCSMVSDAPDLLVGTPSLPYWCIARTPRALFAHTISAFEASQFFSHPTASPEFHGQPLGSWGGLWGWSPTDDGYLCYMRHHSVRLLICNGPTTCSMASDARA
jgi:hypothetical protein